MRNPNAFVHRDILQLRDELAILFSCVLLNSVSHLGEAYRKPYFRNRSGRRQCFSCS